VQANFFDALYGAGEPLDLSRYFLVIPDVIGAGDSSKPSDGLHAHFPRYGYKDQVRAQHLLLEKIGIRRLKLVLGTSMGGMQTWLFPNDMDGLVAIGKLGPSARGGAGFFCAARWDPLFAGVNMYPPFRGQSRQHLQRG
jgi:homoserine O-acetyltransferase/O-succinyltransferase